MSILYIATSLGQECVGIDGGWHISYIFGYSSCATDRLTTNHSCIEEHPSPNLQITTYSRLLSTVRDISGAKVSPGSAA